jgi:putative photosynthetic complex assembly protein 2
MQTLLSFLPAAYAILLWWFSTGIILLLDGLPARTFRWSLSGSAVLAAAGLWGIAATSDGTSVAAAYCSFTGALLVWALIEMSFLMGVVTGSSRRACPDGARGWRRVRCALSAISHHELAILVGAGLVALVSQRGDNDVGLWTFLALWCMRQSAKLNLFLGVRNTGEQFLPPRIEYMKSFFRKRPMNVLFPISISVLTAGSAMLIEAAHAAPPGSMQAAALTLIATLVVLGALEHWFLMLPLNTDALWRWSMGTRERSNPRGADPLRAVPAPTRYTS